MTDTSPAAIAAILDGTTPGPWLYRPTEYDDWGTVKAGDFHLLQVRNPNCYTMEHLNQARIDKVDPWEGNARFIAAARELVPVLAAERDAAVARAEAAEALLGRWLNVADYCEISDGVCGCGDNMANHAEPMSCGHVATDHGGWVASILARDTRMNLAALAKIGGA